VDNILILCFGAPCVRGLARIMQGTP
jgi:hypothetical protein